MYERASRAAMARPSGGFARDRRFATPAERAASEPDPVEAAYARGFAEGTAAGAGAAQAEAAAAEAARDRIETALATIDADTADAFAARLQTTVLALCQTLLGDIAIVPDKLARRVALAAAMFSRTSDERVIRLNPEDLALVHTRLPEAWHCEPDPTLERGTVRVETAGGGVEDGPAQWRIALEEALGSL